MNYLHSKMTTRHEASCKSDIEKTHGLKLRHIRIKTQTVGDLLNRGQIKLAHTIMLLQSLLGVKITPFFDPECF